MSERINVTKPALPSFDEYIEEIRELWDSRWLSNRGPKSIQLEEQIAAYLGVPHTCLFANGHLALEVAIQAMNLTGEVITTPYTYCSTTHAIVRNGLTPVFCDVKEDDFTIDPDLIEDLITENTSAIVATHVYGFLCDVDKIQTIADKHNLKVIYDAAHAFGVKKNGIGAGNFGDAAMFSTHATKVFHTIEGGIVTYRDPEVFPSLPYLVHFGFTTTDDIDYIGTNARMNEFEAAMGLCNLRHIDQWIAQRKVAGDRYFERLSSVDGAKLFTIPADMTWNYAYFPVVFDGRLNRDDVKAALEAENVFARKYFYPSIDQAACYCETYGDLELPVSHYAADHVLALPMSSGITVEEVDRICDVIQGL